MAARIGFSDLFIEVCVDSFESAAAAVRGGASRLEVCSELSVSGVTPSLGLVAEVCRAFPSLPVVSLIRPRSGTFTFSESEFSIMKFDIESFARVGAKGVAIGALTTQNEVDVEGLKPLVTLCKSLKLDLCFHRAFDLTPSLPSALETIISMGFDRILTSAGFGSLAEKGAIPALAELVKQANGKIQILPGGGVNEETLPLILSSTQLREVHASARIMVKSKPSSPEALALAKGLGAHERWVCSEDRVANLKSYGRARITSFPLLDLIDDVLDHLLNHYFGSKAAEALIFAMTCKRFASHFRKDPRFRFGISLEPLIESLAFSGQFSHLEFLEDLGWSLLSERRHFELLVSTSAEQGSMALFTKLLVKRKEEIFTFGFKNFRNFDLGLSDLWFLAGCSKARNELWDLFTTSRLIFDSRSYARGLASVGNISELEQHFRENTWDHEILFQVGLMATERGEIEVLRFLITKFGVTYTDETSGLFLDPKRLFSRPDFFSNVRYDRECIDRVTEYFAEIGASLSDNEVLSHCLRNSALQALAQLEKAFGLISSKPHFYDSGALDYLISYGRFDTVEKVIGLYPGFLNPDRIWEYIVYSALDMRYSATFNNRMRRGYYSKLFDFASQLSFAPDSTLIEENIESAMSSQRTNLDLNPGYFDPAWFDILSLFFRLGLTFPPRLIDFMRTLSMSVPLAIGTHLDRHPELLALCNVSNTSL